MYEGKKEWEGGEEDYLLNFHNKGFTGSVFCCAEKNDVVYEFSLNKVLNL